MKFLWSGLFLLGCLVWGCTQSPSLKPSYLDDWMEENGKLKVLSTTAMIDDLVAKIGKERVNHLALIIGEIDPHSYEIVKGDEEKFSRADIIFYNGLGLEHGASVCAKLRRHPVAIALGDKIREKRSSDILVRKGSVDPHIWMDVLLWIEAVDPIVERLTMQDPLGAAEYYKNGELLKQEMEALNANIVSEMNKIPSCKKFLVTSHDAFNYFTRRYLSHEKEDWNVRFRAPEGLAPDGQLSSADIQGIIDHLCEYGINVVFSESNVSKDSLKKIVSACREKGLSVRISSKMLHADALGPKESSAGDYFKMMEHNTQVLSEEWK